MAQHADSIRCLIIGSGPAGYTAALYAARADLKPVLYEGLQPGGQLTITTEIENFPGYPEGVDANQMMADLKKQAERFGSEIRSGTIEKVDFSQRPFRLVDSNEQEILAETVIVATGASARWLGLESERKFRGMGVSACATCDGFFYRNQEVCVVGGGDTACEEANYLAKICKKVYLVVRRDELRASKAMQQRTIDNPKIEIVWKHKPKEILGDDSGVTSILLMHSDTGIEKNIAVTGCFVAIGHKPNSDLVSGQIITDESGYIKTLPDSSKTNIEGVFAAGDVKDPHYRQAIVAAGSGCQAAMDAERFLSEHNL